MIGLARKPHKSLIRKLHVDYGMVPYPLILLFRFGSWSQATKRIQNARLTFRELRINSPSPNPLEF